MSTRDSTPQMRYETGEGFLAEEPLPGLLLAHAPRSPRPVDRLPLNETGRTVGRDSDADWCIPDPRLSKKHTRFFRSEGLVLVEDLGSTNGTYLRGERLGSTPTVAHPGDIIRCGRSLIAVTADLRALASGTVEAHRFGLAGRFHSPAILAALAESAAVGRHALLSGDSGTGKELAAGALAGLLMARGQLSRQYSGKPSAPRDATGDGPAEPDRGRPEDGLLAHNCAQFANEEEATTTLFGVTSHVFSGVKPRAGLLERAAGGVLFLDEVHALPRRVQQSLLRFVEDQQFSRIGEGGSRPLPVTLVLGTNRDVDQACQDGLIAFDLVNRLQRVHLPALNQRRSDVPDIFLHHLRRAASRPDFDLDADELVNTIRPAHLEAICLIDFSRRNVRELISLAETLAARTASHRLDPQTALGRLLAERYPENPVIRRALAKRSRHAPPTGRSASSRDAAPGSHAPRSTRPADEAPGRASNPPHAAAAAGGDSGPANTAANTAANAKRTSPAKGHSQYERNKEAIIEAYHRARGNLSETERILKAAGYPGSRRWLAKYLEKWGIR